MLKVVQTAITRYLFQEDVAVMRIAARNDCAVVNIRGCDIILSDWVISRFGTEKSGCTFY